MKVFGNIVGHPEFPGCFLEIRDSRCIELQYLLIVFGKLYSRELFGKQVTDPAGVIDLHALEVHTMLFVCCFGNFRQNVVRYVRNVCSRIAFASDVKFFVLQMWECLQKLYKEPIKLGCEFLFIVDVWIALSEANAREMSEKRYNQANNVYSPYWLLNPKNIGKFCPAVFVLYYIGGIPRQKERSILLKQSF